MNKKTLVAMEKKFLKKLYNRKGAWEISRISEDFYGIGTESVKQMLEDLIEQEKCVLEEFVDDYDKKMPVIFITSFGLMDVKKADERADWVSKNLTYEQRCHGYQSISEYLEAERGEIKRQQNISRVMIRIMGSLQYLSMEYKKDEDFSKQLQDIWDLLEKRIQECNLSDDMNIVMLKAAIEKLMADQEKDEFLEELNQAWKLLRYLLRKRHKIDDEYRYYGEF